MGSTTRPIAMRAKTKERRCRYVVSSRSGFRRRIATATMTFNACVEMGEDKRGDESDGGRQEASSQAASNRGVRLKVTSPASVELLGEHSRLENWQVLLAA